MAKSKTQKKQEASPNGHSPAEQTAQVLTTATNNEAGDEKLSPFLKKQKAKLLQLRDSLLDAMMGVSRDTLRARAEGSEASAFGMHQADAGSDAYDRDFALSLLSQEQDALYEIEEALKRIDGGTYGVCEMSGKPIPHARLEAIPFARYTVECQTLIEKQKKATRIRQPVTSLFGLTDEEGGDGEEEEPASDNKE
jgi:RNA polymerase-binding transcription factor DksA